MLSIRCFPLTFLRFFCRIKVYKGEWHPLVAILCCGALLCGGCGTANPSPSPSPVPIPDPVVETTMHGVWLSYIELDEMLQSADPEAAITTAIEVCEAEGLNTVFFHVRAHGDAYFPSAVWPMATAMTANFDPLACAVAEAHKRGLQLHAWVNPYRIGASPAKDAVCFEKSGVWYYAPHDAAARQLVLDGVRDILHRYDVDGIHFDDYFYPTGMSPEGEPFEAIPPGTDVTAWRQTQVDALVSGVYGLCRQYGKVFGVSPVADVHRCTTQAYADVSRWMAEAGYLDYVCPQLYVGFRHQTKPFGSLLTEWASLPRRDGVRLYVGLALYKVGMENDPYAGTGADEWVTDEDILPRQIEAACETADGYVLFRYGNLT